MKGLKRSVLGGESLFITTYTAPANGGWVDVAHHLAGDIIVAGVLPDQPMFVTKGCWLASARPASSSTRSGAGSRTCSAARAASSSTPRGQGTIVLACYGAIDTINLAAGRVGHDRHRPRVAYGPTVTSQLRKVATGLMQTLKSGEGFVFDFTGPGWVMTQSRNPSALAAWIRRSCRARPAAPAAAARRRARPLSVGPARPRPGCLHIAVPSGADADLVADRCWFLGATAIGELDRSRLEVGFGSDDDARRRAAALAELVARRSAVAVVDAGPALRGRARRVEAARPAAAGRAAARAPGVADRR